MRVGLVLGAGGNVGRAFHAGVLAALQDATRWDARGADVIVGTSAGSLDGALLRAGLSPRDLAAHTVGEPLSPEAIDLLRHAPAPIETTSYPWSGRWRPAAPECFFRAARHPFTLRLGTLAAAALPEGIVPMDRIFTLLGPLFGQAWPRRPLWINAVSLQDGQRVVFGRDKAPAARVAEAVAASCAIPGWFCPAKINGTRYVDGGAYSLVNGDLLGRIDLDLVVVSSPMSAVPRAWSTSVDGALRAASHVRLRAEMVRVRMRTKVLVLEPDVEDLKVMGTLSEAMDSSRRAAVARQVRHSMRERLRRLRGAVALRHPSPVQVYAP